MESINPVHTAEAVQITHPYNPAKGGLQNLIQHLAQPLLSLAVRNTSFLVNDVAPHIGLYGDKTTVSCPASRWSTGYYEPTPANNYNRIQVSDQSTA